jgi:hypothetical protein
MSDPKLYEYSSIDATTGKACTVWKPAPSKADALFYKILHHVNREFSDLWAFHTGRKAREVLDASGIFSRTEPPREGHSRLFLRGYWHDLQLLCGYYLIWAAKRDIWGYRLTDDYKLTQAWLSNEEGHETFDSIVRSPEILIIRLGFQTTKNEQLPGLVLQALRQREDSGKRTIVVLEPYSAWAPGGHRAFSAELDAYLTAQYVTVKWKRP